MSFFKAQLDIIEKCLKLKDNRNCIIAGDFNLNDNERYATDYRYKAMFEAQNEIFDNYIRKKVTNSFPLLFGGSTSLAAVLGS